MRAINKGVEPMSLTAHRNRRPSDYDNYAAKNDLRRALVTEQRGLCCYCMASISAERGRMKIEHWKCQAHHSGEQLNYRNLLGACHGGHGRPRRLQHCDTRKGNRDLKWNPAEPAHCIEVRVRYEPDGSIHANDPDFDEQLNDVLNLNLPVLKNHRKGMYDAVLQWWKSRKTQFQGRVPRERLDRQRARYDTRAGNLDPYCQVAVWLLSQKLAGMAT